MGAPRGHPAHHAAFQPAVHAASASQRGKLVLPRDAAPLPPPRLPMLRRLPVWLLLEGLRNYRRSLLGRLSHRPAACADTAYRRGAFGCCCPALPCSACASLHAGASPLPCEVKVVFPDLRMAWHFAHRSMASLRTTSWARSGRRWRRQCQEPRCKSMRAS